MKVKGRVLGAAAPSHTIIFLCLRRLGVVAAEGRAEVKTDITARGDGARRAHNAH